MVRMILHSYSLSPEFWSAIAAILSLLLALRIERFNANKNKKKANTELYGLISILVGFIDFVQYTFLHDTSTIDECSDIIKRIRTIDKNMLEYDKAYFYNDEYDEKVLLKTADFIEQYIAWRGYQCVIELDCFSEMNNIVALQRSAIEAISEIISVYRAKRNKISTLLSEEAISRMHQIYAQNQVQAKHFISVGTNLRFFIGAKGLAKLYKINENDEFQLSRLIPGCYKLSTAIKPSYPFNSVDFREAYQFFFNTSITQFVISSDDGIYFINDEMNKIDAKKVFKLLFYISNLEDKK